MDRCAFVRTEQSITTIFDSCVCVGPPRMERQTEWLRVHRQSQTEKGKTEKEKTEREREREREREKERESECAEKQAHMDRRENYVNNIDTYLYTGVNNWHIYCKEFEPRSLYMWHTRLYNHVMHAFENTHTSTHGWVDRWMDGWINITSSFSLSRVARVPHFKNASQSAGETCVRASVWARPLGHNISCSARWTPCQKVPVSKPSKLVPQPAP